MEAVRLSLPRRYPSRESGFYYLQSRYYDPSIGRFINADAAEYSEMAAYSLADTNLFAYCRNNPVMYTDITGNAPTWWQLTISVTFVAVSIALMITGVGSFFAGALLSAGVNSIVSGYINESQGGSYSAGWYGGMALGAIGGTSASIAAGAFAAASAGVGVSVLGYLFGGMTVGYLGGMFASNVGGWITASLDGTQYDFLNSNNMLMAHLTGVLTVMGGLTGSVSNAVFSAGRAPIYTGLSLGINLGTETISDAVSTSPMFISSSRWYYNSTFFIN